MYVGIAPQRQHHPDGTNLTAKDTENIYEDKMWLKCAKQKAAADQFTCLCQ